MITADDCYPGPRSGFSVLQSDHVATHLHLFPIDVHLDQGVSHQVSEATTVEVAVAMGVVLVVDLRELQTTILMEVFSMEIFMSAEYLQRKEKKASANICNEQSQVSLQNTHAFKKKYSLGGNELPVYQRFKVIFCFLTVSLTATPVATLFLPVLIHVAELSGSSFRSWLYGVAWSMWRGSTNRLGKVLHKVLYT